MLLLIGGALLLFPAVLMPWWPWVLTPLTAHMLGAWLLGAGLILIHARLDGDRRRVRNGLIIYGLFGLLQLLALVRFAGDVQWQNPFRWPMACCCWARWPWAFMAAGLSQPQKW